MRRRAHQLAYMRPVVPDVCPWPMRFQCCPTLDLAASLAAPAVFSAEAADRACQPLSQDRVGSALAGGDAAPNSYFHGCATAAIVSARTRTKPMHLLTPELEIWTPPTLDIVDEKNKRWGRTAGSPTQPPRPDVPPSGSSIRASECSQAGQCSSARW